MNHPIFLKSCLDALVSVDGISADTRFKRQDSGFRIQDSGFRIQDTRFRLQSSFRKNAALSPVKHGMVA
jgi:hypothetical protein